MEIGVASGSDAETFLGIRHALLLPGGAVAVLDGLSSQLRIFEADGALRTVVGGPGEGPGDFKNPTRLRAWADTIEVVDPGNFRRSRYSLDGSLVGELAISRGPDTPLDSWDEWAVGAVRVAGPLGPTERGTVSGALAEVPPGMTSRALVTGEAWIWVELRASGPTDPLWVALAPDGTPAVSLQVPAGLAVMDLFGDYLVGVARDADDVEYVRVHRLEGIGRAVRPPGLEALRGGG